jgi:hypothetical protein
LRLKNPTSTTTSTTKSKSQQQPQSSKQQQNSNKTPKSQQNVSSSQEKNSTTSANNNNNTNNSLKTPQKLQQKLISKTQLQQDSPGQIQILSRNKPLPDANNAALPTRQPSTQATPNKPLNFAESLKNSPYGASPQKSSPAAQHYTPAKGRAPPNMYINSSLSKSSSFANGLGGSNGSGTAPPTPSVPASTSEQAPAASLVPIPFGLTPTKSEQKSSRNALLNALNNAESLKQTTTSNVNGQSLLSTLMARGHSGSSNSLNILGM